MDRLELFALPAAERLPILNEIGIQTIINGPIPVSADGEPIMGLAPELDNFYVACGFTAGIAASGGAGEAMANWIVDGDPGMDLWQFDVRRFGKPQAQGALARGARDRGLWRLLQDPLAGRGDAVGAERRASARCTTRLDARPARCSARNSAGSGRTGSRPRRGAASTGRASKGSPTGSVRSPTSIARSASASPMIDQTSFAKFEVSGPGAAAFLQRIADNDVAGPVGVLRSTPSSATNAAESKPTSPSCGSPTDLYYWRHRFRLRRPRHGAGSAGTCRPTARCILREVTSAFAVINVVGPRARDVLQALTDDDLSNEAFPYLSVREIELGLRACARAARVGYVGELGWELHVPVEYAGPLYDAIWRPGRRTASPTPAIGRSRCCRLEKGYLYWSSDITPETNPYEAGLGFCVKLDKGDFIGRDALVRVKAEGPTRKLVSFSRRRLRAVPRRRDDPPRRQGGRLGDQRRLRPHAPEDDRLRLCPGRARRENPSSRSSPSASRYRRPRGPRCLYDPGNEQLKG